MGSTGVGASAAERETRQQSQSFAQELVAAGPRTVTTSSGARAPAPPPRPDLAYQNRSMIGRIGQDINMGVQSILGRREESGYTPAQYQAYDIRTEQTRARQAAEQRERDDQRDDRPAPVAPSTPAAPAEPVAPPPATPTAPPTPGVDQAQAELEQRVEDLVRDPGELAAAETQAEQEAADALLKGRRSTILTTPGGLLEPEGSETTETRSLLGGRRRRAA